MFLVLTAMAVAFYQLRVASELSGLKDRLLATAVSIAQGIPHEALEALDSQDDLGSPAYTSVVERFAAVARVQREVVSIYAMVPADDPRWLRFACDWVRDGTPGVPGELYALDQAPLMLRGLERAVVEDRPSADRWGLTLSGYAPVLSVAGATVGLVGVDIHAASLEAVRRSVLEVTAVAYAAVAVVLGALAAAVAYNVRRPLGQIIAATAAIEEGRFEPSTSARRQDEFGLLIRRLEEMASGLKERELIRTTLGRYVSYEVVRRVLDEPDTVQLAGEERAVRCALAMRTGLAGLNREWSSGALGAAAAAGGGAGLGARVGIHTGMVVAGTLGDGRTSSTRSSATRWRSRPSSKATTR